MNTCAVCVTGNLEREKTGYRWASLFRTLLSTVLKKSVFLKHENYVADKKRNSCIKHLQVRLKKRKVISSVLTLSCTKKAYSDMIHRATQWPNQFLLI